MPRRAIDGAPHRPIHSSETGRTCPRRRTPGVILPETGSAGRADDVDDGRAAACAEAKVCVGKFPTENEVLQFYNFK